MNGYSQYKEKSIYSMSGPELLLLLFDETIKRLTRAEKSLEDKNYADFDDCIQRTTKIVRYLTDILDMQYPISRNLNRLYDYFSFELNRVKAGRNKTELDRVKTMAGELRDTFREAQKTGEQELAQQGAGGQA